MKAWLKQLSGHLNFTPTERAVVLTLVGAFILGLGVRLLRHGEAAGPAFEYAASDAAFAAKSAAPPAFPAGDSGREGMAGETSGSARPGRAASTDGGVRGATAPSRVDLNRATKRDLMGLPGIGEVIAERILLYREEHGAFAAVDDLLRVKGIGKKKLERIAPHCYVKQ